MSRLLVILALVLGLGAAAAGALIIAPSPNRTLALLAMVVSERSLFALGGGVLAIVLALLGSRPGWRLVATLAVLLGAVGVVLALIPPAQALRLATEQRVSLDFNRYLKARIDTEGPIAAAKTVTYATIDGRKLGLDVYVPSAGSKASGVLRPVLVVHGGGWSAGDKGDNSLASQWLADHGNVVFDVEYPTAPQPNWKAAMGDLKCAIGWVKQHASTPDWNVDPKRMTLLGRSAGGHMALLAAATPGAPDLPPACDAPDTTVESVIALYPPTDLVWGYANPADPRVYDSSDRLRRFIGGPPEATGDLYRRLSPTERVTETMPRTLLIHGGRDQFVGQHHSEVMADKLHAAGVRYETLYVPYAQHGFDFVFGGLSGQMAEAAILRFLSAGGS